MAGFYVLGLIGYPLSHSLSPRLHQAALQALDMEGEYQLHPIAPGPEETANLKNLLNLMRQGKLHGLNVTIPHKQAVVPLLDKLTPVASAVGAVNTILRRDECLVGDNTDVPGFLNDLQGCFGDMQSPGRDGRPVLVLGAGGAARAVVYALARSGWRVGIAARRPQQALDLARELQPFIQPGHLDVIENFYSFTGHETEIVFLDKGTSLIVNATPVGMSPHEDSSPWPEGIPFPPYAAVYDLVYNPAPTVLVQAAREAGLRAVNGLGMLVEQAALSFEGWTGCKPPLAVLWEAVSNWDRSRQ